MDRFSEIIESPNGDHGVGRRFWQGCPTIARAPGGTLYAGWYSGGSKEPSPEQYNILARSRDDGRTWEEPLLVIQSRPEKKIRAIDIQLWLDPRGRLWLFWCRRDDHYPLTDPEHMFTWAMVCDEPDAEKPVWRPARQIAPGFLRCRPTVLSDGRILLCSYDWTNGHYCYSESADGGESWTRRVGGKKLSSEFDETMVVERRDGELLMFARSSAGCVACSRSKDGGATWSDGERTDIVAPSSRLFVSRLASGRVLLVANRHASERRDLTAYLSDDDCLSWKYSLLLDDREPVSYPDAVGGPDGRIRVVYDRGRTTDKEILIADFNESDILNGAPGPGARLRQVISKAPRSPHDESLFESVKQRDAEWYAEFRRFNAF